MERRPGTKGPSPTRSRRPPWWRSLTELRGAQLAFTVLALLVICSLLAGSLGTAVVDGLNNGDADPDEFDSPQDDLAASLRARLEEDPEDTATMLLLANLLGNTGQVPEAITWYERVLALNPDDQTARLDFAQTLTSAGSRADAEIQFLRVIDGDPSNVDAHLDLARLYRDWNPPRIAEAATLYQRTIEIAPAGDFKRERASEELRALGVSAATPIAAPAVASPIADPPATPVNEEGP